MWTEFILLSYVSSFLGDLKFSPNFLIARSLYIKMSVKLKESYTPLKVCAKSRDTVWQTPSPFLYFPSDQVGSLRINSWDYVGYFQRGTVRKKWFYHSENEEGNLATSRYRISCAEKNTLVESLILDRLIFHGFPPQNLLLFHLWAIKEGPCFFLTFRSYKPVSFIE